MAGHTVPPTACTGSLEDSSFDPKIPLLGEFPELIIRKECKEMCRKLITIILFIIEIDKLINSVSHMVDLHIQEGKMYITEMRIYQQCF